MSQLRVPRRSIMKHGLSAAFAASGAAGALGCRPCASTNYGWNNALRTDGIDPERQLTPTSLPELVTSVQTAEQQKLGIRMTGSGHSFSDVAFSDQYLLSPKGLNRVLTVDRAQLRAEAAAEAGLVRVENGITIRELNLWLYERGLALQNLGGYDAQTIVGAAMTGTHGSGLGYGPIASQLRSIQLVTTGGEVLQIEPAAGITDPARFPGYVRTPYGDVPAKLQQDDELFNAASVSLGCLGIVYAIVLQAEPRFWLREVREVANWGALKAPGGFLDRLLKGQPLGEPAPDYYEIYVNPYPPSPGAPAASHVCVLTKRYKLAALPPLGENDRLRGALGQNALEIAVKLTKQGRLLGQYMNDNPKLVPNILNDVLRGLKDDSYVDISYRVFHAGVANEVRAFGIEMAFDLQQTVQATERLFSIAAELRKDDWMHNTPPSLRFVKRSPAHLAMMNGRDTMMLEMGMIVCANHAAELMKHYEKTFIRELGARPHWGLDLNVLQSFDEVRRLYPDSAERFLAIYKQMNRSGTFNGKLTDRLGISVKP